MVKLLSGLLWVHYNPVCSAKLAASWEAELVILFKFWGSPYCWLKLPKQRSLGLYQMWRILIVRARKFNHPFLTELFDHFNWVVHKNTFMCILLKPRNMLWAIYRLSNSLLFWPLAEHVLRKIHHCTFRSKSWTPISEQPFYQKNFYLSSQISEWPFLSLQKQLFIPAHFASSLHILCMTAR